MDEDVATVAMMNWIVARESLDGEVVGRILDLLRDRKAELEQVHEMATQIDLSVLPHAPIPLHQAAEMWLAEAENRGSAPTGEATGTGAAPGSEEGE